MMVRMDGGWNETYKQRIFADVMVVLSVSRRCYLFLLEQCAVYGEKSERSFSRSFLANSIARRLPACFCCWWSINNGGLLAGWIEQESRAREEKNPQQLQPKTSHSKGSSAALEEKKYVCERKRGSIFDEE